MTIRLRRLFLGYLLVPFVPPFLLLLANVTFLTKGVPADLLVSVFVLYGVFGFAALVVLGTPFLMLLVKLGWTGYLPFALGGAGCAFITASTVMSARPDWWQIRFFTCTGVIAAIVVRVILLGVSGLKGSVLK